MTELVVPKSIPTARAGGELIVMTFVPLQLAHGRRLWQRTDVSTIGMTGPPGIRSEAKGVGPVSVLGLQTANPQ